MSDTILPALLLLTAILPIVGGAAALLPRPATCAVAAAVCAAGALLCLAHLLGRSEPASLGLPGGLPGLTLVVALDALNALFLLVVLLCGATILANIAAGGERAAAAAASALTVAGAALTLLAAGAPLLILGLWVAGTGLWLRTRAEPPGFILMAALLALAALCLLAPDDAPSDFAAMRAMFVSPGREAGAAVFSLAAGAVLLAPAASRSAEHTPLMASALLPTGVYLLTRLLTDLPGADIQAWWGYALMLAGAAAVVVMGWRAAGHLELPGAIDALVRQQAAFAVLGLGVCVIGRASDLPDTTGLGLAAAMMLALGGAGLAGTVASLAAAAMSRGASSSRLPRLGGLLRTMPAASAILAVALFSCAAVPPGLGFAGLWLLLQALLSAPRTGGLAAQVALAAAAASACAAAGLAAASSVRLAGIVILGRPRSARASSALDIPRRQWAVLGALAVMATLIGLLPGIMLKALAEPAILMLSGARVGPRAGWMVLSASPSMPGYAALPVLALVLLAAGAIMLLTRRSRAVRRVSTIWTDGLPSPANLPLGEPMAQSAGTGFRPLLPDLPALRPSRPHRRPIAWSGFTWSRLGAQAGLYIVLAALSLLLLASGLTEQSGP